MLFLREVVFWCTLSSKSVDSISFKDRHCLMQLSMLKFRVSLSLHSWDCLVSTIYDPNVKAEALDPHLHFGGCLKKKKDTQ